MLACSATDDFFRSRIDQMIDLRHPLAVLSSRAAGNRSKPRSRTCSCARPARAWPSQTVNTAVALQRIQPENKSGATNWGIESPRAGAQ